MSTAKEKIAVLNKRKHYLMHRISESAKDLSYDRQELEALTWIIGLWEKELLKDNKTM